MVVVAGGGGSGGEPRDQPYIFHFFSFFALCIHNESSGVKLLGNL
jgi:hypothetical protein